MGIPRFFKYIMDTFPNVATGTSFKEALNIAVDNLYLDANGIIHNCAREIYFGQRPSATAARPRLAPKLGQPPKQVESAESRESRVFQAIGAYMDQLLKFVQPRKLFYVAIDGPAPIAKQTQQRQRRYKAAEEKTAEELALFDTNTITPGTKFMYNLGRYLEYYFCSKIQTDRDWQRVQVIFSGATVEGEGEHKIVNYIRQLPNRNQLTHCMYGLDADLFMLSLSTYCPKFYLLREDIFTTSWNNTFFHIVDIGQLRNEMTDAWSLDGQTDRIIDEFIFMCFLIGNDFLHALPAFHELGSSIDFLMELRKEILASEYLINGDNILLGNLAKIFGQISQEETKLISNHFFKRQFPNNTLTSSLIDPSKPHSGIDLNTFRRLYYAKAGIDACNQKAVDKFCRTYIQGLEWVNYYYHNRPQNWGWLFPYHYTPLVTDLWRYLEHSKRISRVSRKIAQPLLPFQQLLCVLPPKSAPLLPRFLQEVYDHPDLKKFYPQSFNIDLEGKLREWEGIALLPFIKLAVVTRVYDEIISSREAAGRDTKFRRNILGRDIRLRLSRRSKPFEYKCPFGTIKKCRVAVAAVSS